MRSSLGFLLALRVGLHPDEFLGRLGLTPSPFAFKLIGATTSLVPRLTRFIQFASATSARREVLAKQSAAKAG